MLVTSFFGHRWIKIDSSRNLLEMVAVKVTERILTWPQHGYLTVVHEDYLLGVIQDGRHIRGQKAFFFSDSHD